MCDSINRGNYPEESLLVGAAESVWKGSDARVNISIDVGQRLADTIGEEIGGTVYLVTAQRGKGSWRLRRCGRRIGRVPRASRERLPWAYVRNDPDDRGIIASAMPPENGDVPRVTRIPQTATRRAIPHRAQSDHERSTLRGLRAAAALAALFYRVSTASSRADLRTDSVFSKKGSGGEAIRRSDRRETAGCR